MNIYTVTFTPCHLRHFSQIYLVNFNVKKQVCDNNSRPNDMCLVVQGPSCIM